MRIQIKRRARIRIRKPVHRKRGILQPCTVLKTIPSSFLNITILDARTTFDTFHGPNLYIRGKVHHVDSNDTKYLFQTNVVENTVKPHFNHTWLYDEARSEPPPEGFTTNDMIVFEIYDHRKTESDLWMGSCQVDLRDAHRHNESGKMKMCRVNRNIWMTTVHYIVTWIVDLQSFAEAGFRSQDVGFDRPPDIVDNPAVLPHAPSHPIEEK